MVHSFLFMHLLGIGIRVILASENELEVFLPLLFTRGDYIELLLNFFFMVDRILE